MASKRRTPSPRTKAAAPGGTKGRERDAEVAAAKARDALTAAGIRSNTPTPRSKPDARGRLGAKAIAAAKAAAGKASSAAGTRDKLTAAGARDQARTMERATKTTRSKPGSPVPAFRKFLIDDSGMNRTRSTGTPARPKPPSPVPGTNRTPTTGTPARPKLGSPVPGTNRTPTTGPKQPAVQSAPAAMQRVQSGTPPPAAGPQRPVAQPAPAAMRPSMGMKKGGKVKEAGGKARGYGMARGGKAR